MKVKNVYGISKSIINLKIKLNVLFHYLPSLIKGEIKLKKFAFFLRRLLIFLSRLQHNKFININGLTKIDFYVPGFPSKAFYTACDKFLVTDKKMPCATVLISITSKCPYNCKHCYQKLDKGKDVDINLLIDTVKKLQKMGVAFFNIEGGEPFIAYERLIELCKIIDEKSEIWVNSTGYGITKERLIELKENGVNGIMFSLHNPDKDWINEFMGNINAFRNMEDAIGFCHEVDMPIAFNSCLMGDDFKNGNFEKVMDKAKEFKVAIIQIIKPKPSGGWLDNKSIVFSNEDIKIAKNKIKKYNENLSYKDYPSISAQIIEESEEVFGCTAGGTDRFYINAKGDIQPCEFLNISFGNLSEEKFDDIYTRMRKTFEKPCDNMLCEKYSGKIARVYKENKLESLPLDKNLSKKIYENWDSGKETKLYKDLG